MMSYMRGHVAPYCDTWAHVMGWGVTGIHVRVIAHELIMSVPIVCTVASALEDVYPLGDV